MSGGHHVTRRGVDPSEGFLNSLLEAHRARVIKMLDVDLVAELVRFADRWVQGLSPR